ncbi:hypothetical protein LTR67_010928 [Exophiala xenobiotica]
MATEPQQPLHQPKPAPNLQIPSRASAKVQIIDSKSNLEAPLEPFMVPAIAGHDTLKAPSHSFLIEQVSSRRKVLFDLAVRVDPENYAPAVVKIISQPGWETKAEKSVATILQENGVDVAGGAIEAIIWSHWHYDHIGNPATFPGSTSLIVGPGVSEALLPAYPSNPESPLLESDFAGRDLIVMDFDKRPTVQLGRFRAIDFFGDGSFYLLDSPGHAIGHMCGLARVTSTQEGDHEDTFVFMGADTAHHGGEFRPTEYLPLPESIAPSPYVAKYANVCPGHIFEAVHPTKKGTEPYYLANAPFSHNLAQAQEMCTHMEEFDAADNVFVIIAHDASILDERVGIEWFPRGDLRTWKARDCAKKARWGFLQDLVKAVEASEIV